MPDEPQPWCKWCDDTGFVVLEGSTRVGGVTYSRGTTTCKYCAAGDARTDSARRVEKGHRRWTPTSEYDHSDLVPHEPRDVRLLTASQAGVDLANLSSMMRPVADDDDLVVPTRMRQRLGDEDWIAAGRRCYDAWCEAGGPTFATEKVRETYPIHADEILDGAF